MYSRLSKPLSVVLWSERDSSSESATALSVRKAASTSWGGDSVGESRASRGEMTRPAWIGDT